ncbi:hypothetical protein VNI00_005002 [Paramarasmius palmivorus]
MISRGTAMEASFPLPVVLAEYILEFLNGGAFRLTYSVFIQCDCQVFLFAQVEIQIFRHLGRRPPLDKDASGLLGQYELRASTTHITRTAFLHPRRFTTKPMLENTHLPDSYILRMGDYIPSEECLKSTSLIREIEVQRFATRLARDHLDESAGRSCAGSADSGFSSDAHSTATSDDSPSLKSRLFCLAFVTSFLDYIHII